MTITFNHVIAHNIVKESGKDDINSVISDKCYDKNDSNTNKLAQKIYDSFGKKSNRPDLGRFKSKSTRGEFAAECCTYASKEKIVADDFIALSQKFVEELLARLVSLKNAIGGYIICLNYTDEDLGDYILFAIIRDEEKFIFTANLDIKETATINTEKLRLAFKIELSLLKKFNQFEEEFSQKNDEDIVEDESDDDLNFLRIVAATEADKTNYFCDLLGFEKGLNSKKSTEVLFKFISEKCSTHKSLHDKIDDIKDKTAGYLHEKKNTPVSLNDLQAFCVSNFGSYIENEEDRELFFGSFADEMASDKYGMPNSFIPHKGALEKQTHTVFKNPNFDIKLRSSQINTTDPDANIYLDQEEGILTIRAEELKTLLPH